MGDLMIIGLIGYAASGKDTLAKGLLAHGWCRVAFADQLKADVHALGDRIGVDLASLPKDTIRPLYVAFGEAVRAAKPRHWIMRAMDRIEQAMRAGCSVVVTDVRYPNEADYIHSRGGKLVRVVRDGVGPANLTEEASIMVILGCYPEVVELDNSGSIAAGQRELIRVAIEDGGMSQ